MLVYAVVAVPLAIGLIRGRAPTAKIAFFPVLALPVTALAVLFVSMMQSSLRSWAPMLLTARHFELVAFTTLVLFGYLGGLAAARQRADLTHKRGARIEDGTRLQRKRASRKGRRGQGNAKATLTLAGIAIPPTDETKHFKMIGTTGTGKSTAIRELLEGALARGDRAVIADPDGGYLARFYDASRGDVILNPFDPRAHTWHIYGELTAAHDVEQLARALIPDHDGRTRAGAVTPAPSSPPSHVRPTRPAFAICPSCIVFSPAPRPTSCASWSPARRRNRSSRAATNACSARSAR